MSFLRFPVISTPLAILKYCNLVARFLKTKNLIRSKTQTAGHTDRKAAI